MSFLLSISVYSSCSVSNSGLVYLLVSDEVRSSFDCWMLQPPSSYSLSAACETARVRGLFRPFLIEKQELKVRVSSFLDQKTGLLASRDQRVFSSSFPSLSLVTTWSPVSPVRKSSPLFMSICAGGEFFSLPFLKQTVGGFFSFPLRAKTAPRVCHEFVFCLHFVRRNSGLLLVSLSGSCPNIHGPP